MQGSVCSIADYCTNAIVTWAFDHVILKLVIERYSTINIVSEQQCKQDLQGVCNTFALFPFATFAA